MKQYNVYGDHISRGILQRAFKLAGEMYRVDMLDSAFSFRRMSISASFKEYMDVLCSNKVSKCSITLIERNHPQRRNYFELCADLTLFSSTVTYFLWIELDEQSVNKLIYEYSLKERK